MSSTVLSSVEPYPVVLSQDLHYHQPFFLLSASLDSTVKIYAPENIDDGTGVFTTCITYQPHLIGSQGFWGGQWLVTSTRRHLFAYGYHGAMFHWEEDEDYSSYASINRMNLKPFITGHFNECKSKFSTYGNLIISSSLDRTVRIWGRELSEKKHWKEVSRPIVHGYPVTDVILIKDHHTNEGCCNMTNQEIGRLITINEEKKGRIFDNTYLNLITFNTMVDCVDSANYRDQVEIESTLSFIIHHSSFIIHHSSFYHSIILSFIIHHSSFYHS